MKSSWLLINLTAPYLLALADLKFPGIAPTTKLDNIPVDRKQLSIWFFLNERTVVRAMHSS